MSTQHTPGQWEAVDKRPDGFCGYSVFAGSQFIAHVGDTDRRTPVEANARLIAASPLMYNYIAKRARESCSEASSILDVINA